MYANDKGTDELLAVITAENEIRDAAHILGQDWFSQFDNLYKELTQQYEAQNGKRTDSRNTSNRKTDRESLVSATSSTDPEGLSRVDTRNGASHINQGNSKTERTNDEQGNTRTEEEITTDDSQGFTKSTLMEDAKISVLQKVTDV